MTRKLSAIAGAMSALALLYWLGTRPSSTSARRQTTARPAPVPQREEPVDQLAKLRAMGPIVAEGSSFRQDDAAGNPLYEIKGRKIVNEPDQERVRVEIVEATLYESGKPAALFRAQEVRIIYRKNEELLSFLGRVEIQSRTEKARMTAGQVDFQPALRTLTARHGIRFWYPGVEASCEQLTANLLLQRIKLSGRVRGTLTATHGL